MRKYRIARLILTISFLCLGMGFSLPAVETEALWYTKKDNKNVVCMLCPFQCLLSAGQRGQCGVRINKQGVLYTQVYGEVAAAHVDPIRKKPLNHFLPGSRSFSIGTAGCNLHCKFCQNWQLSQSRPEDLNTERFLPDDIVRDALKFKCKSVSYTYNEPIIFYEYVVDTAKKAKAAGLYNVLVTAGYINEEPLRALAKYIDAAHVDLKSFSEEYYRSVVSGSLPVVQRTLRILREEHVWVEVVYLVVPTLNDDMADIEKMCRWIKEVLGADTPIHFSRFYPMYKLKDLPPTPVKMLEAARSAALRAGLKYVYIGNVPGHPGEYTYCPKCGKVIIKSAGYTIEENHISNGKCSFCGEPIAGVWE